MINRAAKWLVKELKEQEIVIMRYDSYSSRSIYLKLDDGVIGTIRISDHKGKKHLSYKYNLIENSKLHKWEHKGITRYQFPMREIERLVNKIMYDRQELKDKYGQENYEKFMETNREKGSKAKGFWQKAKYV